MAISRRGLFRYAGALPCLTATSAHASPFPITPDLPPGSLLAEDPERYWAWLRKEQFLLPDDFAYLHNGSLGVPPIPVLAAVAAGLAQSGRVDFEPINRWGAPIEEVNARNFLSLRQDLARTFCCDTEELTLTANATQALSMIASGLDLGAGDEVLITNLEHPANVSCWSRLSRTQGITLRKVQLNLAPQSESSILAAFEQAMNPRTRVVSFSAVLTSTGVRLPVEKIVALARANGAVTVVDGAHLPGQVPLDLKALGCDYLAASPHKWMFAPAGCGLLFGRGTGLDTLAQRITPEGPEGSAADRLMQTGTASGATFDGYQAALDFFLRIGPEKIFSRLSRLRDLMLEGAKAIPGASLYTPHDPARSAGMVAFSVEGVELKRFEPDFRRAGIRVAPGRGIRLSAHVHTRPGDIERFFDVLRRCLRRGEGR